MPSPDLTTEAAVVALMEMSQTEEEWNRNCDAVKAANGRAYPAFWHGAIVRSGLMRRVTARFGKDDRIHITMYDGTGH